MASNFYVAIKNKEATLYAAWEECKKHQKLKGGVCKGFNSFEEANAWAKEKGVTLQREDIPDYYLYCEPVISLPVIKKHIMPIVKENEIRIFTDGSCLSNPGGPGGFGSMILLPDGTEVQISGREVRTTNNRMELMAALSALDYIEQIEISDIVTDIAVITDSRYLQNIFDKKWIKRWKSNGWVTSTGSSVQNQDLLELLDWLVEKVNVRFIWIKSHNGNKLNEAVDRLAVEEAKKAARECGFPLDCEAELGITLPKSSSFNREQESKNPKDRIDKILTSIKENENGKTVAKSTTVTAEEESFSFPLSYRNLSMGKQKTFNGKKRKNAKSLNPTGNTVRRVSLRVELQDDTMRIIPITAKQNELINLILGIDAQDDSMSLKMFDDKTLEKILVADKNPLPMLLKKYKRPFFRKEN